MARVAILVVLVGVALARAHYTPTWAVHVPGGKVAADALAADHGFINLGEIFEDHFHFHHNAVSKRSLSPAHEHHDKLEGDRRVKWAKQQRALSRKKRDFVTMNVPSTAETQPSRVPSTSSASKRDANFKRELQSSRVKGRPRSADSKFQLNDPKWPHMWYLNRGGGLDMNVIPAWREGITGRGVVVTILDDGLETDHPDLVANYDPLASYDVNSHDSDPQPRYDVIDSNRHGTRCAGEVAATANNSLCTVGVAYGASVGGVRMLDGEVTDAVEARSLSLNPQHVDIYSASWGPDDDGKTVDGPGELATRAFIEGVTKGRSGKGSIFVWASGNGGREQDNCNCDGYTNSIWTLSISSATERGEVPWYSEMCSSTLAATYSSGSINEKQVITTDLHHSCTTGHTGTSASAPLAAGICALALQANKDLTWRDMQHIVVRTARPERLSSDGKWQTNGVGRNVSHSFGYGLLDAAGMVRMARSWKTVPPQRRCELAAPRSYRAVPPHSSVTLQLDVVSCPGVKYLEHIQARVTLSASRRGDIRIILTSPAGTKVTLLAPRAHDSSRAGFTSWPFMSVHMWGESPVGIWQLQVFNDGRYSGGPLSQWELIFYGTETPPQPDIDIPPQMHPVDANGESTWQGPERPESVEEIKHNVIDDDFSSGWHDSQTAPENKRTDTELAASHGTSGCARLSQQPPHHCLECAKGMHMYAGHCYASCPDGTYSDDIVPGDTDRTSRRRKPVNTPEKRQKEGQSESADMNQLPTHACLPCHYSCATCSAPENHDCLTCHSDAQLVNSTDGLTDKYFCIATSALPQIHTANWTNRLHAALTISLIVATVIALYYFITFILKKCGFYYGHGGHVKDNVNLEYQKLAVDDKKQDALDIEDEIHKAIQDYSSDSETEEDMNL